MENFRKKFNLIVEGVITISTVDGTQITADIFRPDSNEKFTAIFGFFTLFFSSSNNACNTRSHIYKKNLREVFFSWTTRGSTWSCGDRVHSFMGLVRRQCEHVWGFLCCLDSVFHCLINDLTFHMEPWSVVPIIIWSDCMSSPHPTLQALLKDSNPMENLFYCHC